MENYIIVNVDDFVKYQREETDIFTFEFRRGFEYKYFKRKAYLFQITAKNRNKDFEAVDYINNSITYFLSKKFIKYDIDNTYIVYKYSDDEPLRIPYKAALKNNMDELENAFYNYRDRYDE